MRKVDNNILEELNKIFISKEIDVDSKKELIKLRKIYMENLKLEDISEVERKLYKNKTNEEKLVFEITRIKMNVFNSNGNKKQDEMISRLLCYLEKIIKLKNNTDAKIYENLFNSIIKIELQLDMKIGLLEEFNLYFENEIKRYLDIINNYGIDDFEKKNIKKLDK